MQLTERETEHLRIEAWRTYREYGQVRQLHRDDRANSELKRRLALLETRYTELEEQLFLKAGRARDTETRDEYRIDIDRLEPTSSGLHNTFARGTPLRAEAPLSARMFRMGRVVRVGASLVLLFAALSVLFLITNQDLGFFIVPSSSMEPTLVPNDRLITYSSRDYRRGDVVVVRDPDDPGGNLVKRIVGVSGDVVAIRNAGLVVNGVPVREPYLNEEMDYRLDPVHVGPSEVFLLGDNRNQSHDSHIWKRGVPLNSILGSVRTIYSPRARVGAQIRYTDIFSDVDRARGHARAAAQTEPIS